MPNWASMQVVNHGIGSDEVLVEHSVDMSASRREESIA